jgi:hypothetical protein
MVQVAPCARCRVLPCSGTQRFAKRNGGRRAGKSLQEKCTEECANRQNVCLPRVIRAGAVELHASLCRS